MLYEIIAEPEVGDFLLNSSPEDLARADFRAALLAERGPELAEPYCRYLGEGVRELRFEISRNRAVRITYWFPGARKVIMLTAFTKSGSRNPREVERAKIAKKVCENEHDRTYHRVFTS